MDARRAFLVYNLARLGLLAVATLVVYLAGVRNILWALVIGLVVSAAASWWLLAKPRAALSAALDDAVQQRRRRAAQRDEAEAAEDAGDAGDAEADEDEPPGDEATGPGRS